MNNHKKYRLYKRNIKKEIFYRKRLDELFKDRWAKLNERPLKFNEMLILLVILVSVVTLFTSVYITSYKKDQQVTRTLATGNRVKLILFPKQIEVRRGENFYLVPKLVGNNEKKIASIIFSINFDTRNVRLAHVQTDFVRDKFGLSKFTPIETANKSGKLKIFLGANNLTVAPQAGVVDLPLLSFDKISDADSSIDFIKGAVQVVFTTKETAELEFDSPARVIPKSRASISPQKEISPTIKATLTPIVEITTIEPTLEISPTLSETKPEEEILPSPEAIN